MDLEEKNTLFKIRRTVLEMVLDRKYIIPLSENIDFEEFIIKYNNKNLDIHIFDENKGNIYIHFHRPHIYLPLAFS